MFYIIFLLCLNDNRKIQILIRQRLKFQWLYFNIFTPSSSEILFSQKYIIIIISSNINIIIRFSICLCALRAVPKFQPETSTDCKPTYLDYWYNCLDI